MNNTKHKNTQWFTLVELVVVATILAILWAVWFSAYTWYIDGARDSNRIVELSSIRSWLQTYLISSNNGLPLPWDFVTIQDWIEKIWYQGYASQNILDTIDLKKWGTDPLDGSFYSYFVSESRNHFQLLWFLEEPNSDLASASPLKSVKALDFSSRYPTVTWESLWIMVWTWDDLNTPIQELDQVVITSNGILDIWGTSTQYTAIIKDDYTITWDSTELGVLASLGRSWWQIRGSCKELIESNPGLIWKDGTYLISPDWETKFEVECDMTVDWWGWTLYSAKWSYWYSWNGHMQANQILKDNVNFLEFMWIFTSPSWTVASYRYKFFNEEEWKRAIHLWELYFDNNTWTNDSSIHYSSAENLASAVDITNHDTTWLTTSELRGYIINANRNFFSGWVRSSNNEVSLWFMSYATFNQPEIRSNYLWFPQTPYTGTWRVWSDTFASETNWTDWRSISIWIR